MRPSSKSPLNPSLPLDLKTRRIFTVASPKMILLKKWLSENNCLRQLKFKKLCKQKMGRRHLLSVLPQVWKARALMYSTLMSLVGQTSSISFPFYCMGTDKILERWRGVETEVSIHHLKIDLTCTLVRER